MIELNIFEAVNTYCKSIHQIYDVDRESRLRLSQLIENMMSQRKIKSEENLADFCWS